MPINEVVVCPVPPIAPAVDFRIVVALHDPIVAAYSYDLGLNRCFELALRDNSSYAVKII